MVGETFVHLGSPHVWELVEVDQETWKGVLRGAGGRIRVALGDLYLSGVWKSVRCL